jgi:prepilin-type N-terminal cleavage/methylation domain-containing protein
MNKGFSLLETVLSLFLIGILIGISSISFLDKPPKYKLKKAVWEVNSRMNFARYKSIFENVKVRIVFHESGYRVEKYDPLQKKWDMEVKKTFDGVTITATNSPIFHPLGTVSNLASVYISNSAGKYRISLAISGRIKVIPL